jgi:transcriptional regulator with XRE-family HTH domain
MLIENLKYLRKKHGQSQQDLADVLSIPRSTLSGYERGYSEPPISTLIRLSEYYQISIDALVKSRLANEELVIHSDRSMKVLAITLDESESGNIELVETKAEAGYLESFSDPQYIKDLPRISLPDMPSGTFRAFQIRGDSMLPMEEGTIVVCSYVERISDIKADKTYVVISKNDGVVYKRIRANKERMSLSLISDNELYLPYELPYEEIAELWQYHAHIAFSDSKDSFDSMLDERLTDIQRKLNEVHQLVVKP